MWKEELLKRLLKVENPYPESMFKKPTHEEYKIFNETLKKVGLTPDRYNGIMGRMVWKTCLAKIRELIEGMELTLDEGKIIEELRKFDETNKGLGCKDCSICGAGILEIAHAIAVCKNIIRIKEKK